MRKIKRFEPLSVMRISAIFSVVLGLVEVAILVSPALLRIHAGTSEEIAQESAPFTIGLSILFIPVLSGTIGALLGYLGAVVYNVSARFVGGIAFEVE